MRIALSMLVSVFLSIAAYAQTRSWSEGGCVPVTDISDGDSLAYQAGEKFSFSIHYEWGLIDSDVGWADIELDTLRLNGRKAFHCRVHGRTTRLYDLFFPVRRISSHGSHTTVSNHSCSQGIPRKASTGRGTCTSTGATALPGTI